MKFYKEAHDWAKRNGWERRSYKDRHSLDGFEKVLIVAAMMVVGVIAWKSYHHTQTCPNGCDWFWCHKYDGK